VVKKLRGAFAPLFVFSVLCCSPVFAAGANEAYLPAADSEVLEVLPARLSGEDELGRLRREQSFTAANDPAAEKFVKKAIEAGRASGDARYFGYAEAALSSRFASGKVTAPLYTLRAIVRQHGHDFTGALEDLDAALALEPRAAQALLTKASIHFVRGEFERGRRSCLVLSTVASPFVSVVCAAEAASKSGGAAESEEVLRRLLAESGGISPAERNWGLGLLGDILVRLDRSGEAERVWREALELSPGDAHTLAPLADHLLEAGRFDEAVRLLKGKETNDALAVRLEDAYRRAGLVEEANRLAAGLRLRFADQLRLESGAHLREYAMFLLNRQENRAEAFRLAKENWERQRETDDTRLFVRAALDRRERAALAPLERWLAETRYEDIPLRRMMAKVEEK
jgi:tetratricopeptide (TPR) repeat protein